MRKRNTRKATLEYERDDCPEKFEDPVSAVRISTEF